MEFTKEQARAIKERNTDILVSAGAGAGKTRVLVNRIADLITDPDMQVSADQILVMTFTNAAAREMKERIRKELADRLLTDPENIYLRRQIRLIRQADISTVHSFCSRLLRTHFQQIGLDPSFRIGDQGELFVLARQALEETLEEAYKEGSPDFLNFIEAYVPGKDDHKLEEYVESLYQFSRGFPDGEGWFRDRIDQASAMSDPEGFDSSLPVRRLMDQTDTIIRGLADMLSDLRKSCESHQEETGQAIPARFEEILKEDEQAVATITGLTSYQEYHEAFKAMDFKSLPTGTKEEKKYAYLERIKEAHKQVKETLEPLREKDYRYTKEELCLENAKIIPCLSALSRLVFRYDALYFTYKKEQNVYDFNDLEHMTLDLLVSGYSEDGTPVPSETALDLSRKYKEIFVDEYQDTSMIQETILTLLHRPGENHLFTVGDIKQSIYRFRQARPDLFLARYAAYAAGPAGPCPLGRNITLRDNYRSAPQVLSLCNRVFYTLMDEDFGGICYDENNALRVGKGSPMEEISEKSECMLLIEDEEKDQLPFVYDALFAETAMIAGRIRDLLDEGYEYGDMVILLRSGADRAQTMVQYLKMMDISAECQDKKGYFGSLEVAVILNYLSVIDNVRQDIPMASVLLSSIGGFTEEDLARLKCFIEIPMRGHLCLYELLTLYVDTGEEEELKRKAGRFLDRLARFRQLKKEMPLHQLLWTIYQETGFYYDVLLMPDGSVRRDNLNMLLQKAEDYENTVFKGLFYFIRYIEQLKSYEVELPEAGSRAVSPDKVRIMTIHKSKGLEFPVVFVSALSARFNFRDTNGSLLYHPKLGLGIDVVDTKARLKHSSLMKNMIKDEIRKEMLEEEMRILYVAMTRAKNRLILTGTVKANEIVKHQDTVLDSYTKLRATSFMSWILPIFVGGEAQEDMGQYLTVKHLHQIEFPEEAKTGEAGGDPHKTLLSRLDTEDYSPVEKAFSYVYPYTGTVSFKRKYSVSELKKLSMTAPSEEGVARSVHDREYISPQMEEEENTIPLPAFLGQEKKPDPAMRGTIIHKIMELLPFGKIDSKKDLYDAIRKIEGQYEKTELVSMKEVYTGAEAFVFSDEGERVRRMDREGRFFREVPFTVSLPASFLGYEDEGGETIIVQGIIDAYGEDEQGLWLIDYKTDHIREGEEQLLLDRYHKQMLYYKTALSMLVKKPVTKISIYSFALKKYIEVKVGM